MTLSPHFRSAVAGLGVLAASPFIIVSEAEAQASASCGPRDEIITNLYERGEEHVAIGKIQSNNFNPMFETIFSQEIGVMEVLASEEGERAFTILATVENANGDALRSCAVATGIGYEIITPEFPTVGIWVQQRELPTFNLRSLSEHIWNGGPQQIGPNDFWMGSNELPHISGVSASGDAQFIISGDLSESSETGNSWTIIYNAASRPQEQPMHEWVFDWARAGTDMQMVGSNFTMDADIMERLDPDYVEEAPVEEVVEPGPAVPD